MGKKNINPKKLRIAGTLICVAAYLSICAVLILCKILRPNLLLIQKYQVKGVDVSHYQGEICWDILGNQGIEFAYIKATEGSSYVDENFSENWEEASDAGLFCGAYHFFSFDSSGEAQALHFIRTVGDLSGKLIPVVDVEYYGQKERNPPRKEDVRRELRMMLELLEEEYGVRPMIYTTLKIYRRYIEDEFDRYPLWIRNVYYSPDADLKGRWQFWQYTDRAVMEGYQGVEKYIDCNVFAGNREELMEYIVK